MAWGILTLISVWISFERNVQIIAAGRYLSRYRSYNLLFPPDALTFSAIVLSRAECLTLLAPIADACCTIYDNATHNCTVVRTDRFQLVPNASASLEVGIDRALVYKIVFYFLQLFINK